MATGSVAPVACPGCGRGDPTVCYGAVTPCPMGAPDADPHDVPADESAAAVLAQLRGEVLAMRSELAALHEALRPVLELVEQARQIPRLAAQLRKVER